MNTNTPDSMRIKVPTPEIYDPVVEGHVGGLFKNPDQKESASYANTASGVPSGVPYANLADQGLGINKTIKYDTNPEDPDALIGALLSEAVYYGKSKAFGWHGINENLHLKEEQKEFLRSQMALGRDIPPAEAEKVRQGFWRDDLQDLILGEIRQGKLDTTRREELARRLWIALYTEPMMPEGAKEQTLENEKSSPYSAKNMVNGGAGFTRPGVFRSNDVHCMVFTKVWNPEDKFSQNNDTLWLAARGTENQAKALRAPIQTFVEDYVLKSYRNFSKSFVLNYKDAASAVVGQVIKENMTADRPKINNIKVAGHSLGGAIATEAVLQLGSTWENQGLNVKGFTFGSPSTGKVGLVSGAGGLGLMIAAGLSHIVRYGVQAGFNKINPFGSETDDSRSFMTSKAKGIIKDTGRTLRSATGHLINAVLSIPGIAQVDDMVRTVFNHIDANATGATGLKKWGWAGFRRDGDEDFASQEGRLTHYAHQGDFIPKVGECLGFESYGKKVSLNRNQPLELSPIAEHAGEKYVSSLQDLMVKQNQTEHYVMRSLEGCRKVVDQMMMQQAWLHRVAVERKMERAFIEQQMESSFTFDRSEAPAWCRQAVAVITKESPEASLSIDSFGNIAPSFELDAAKRLKEISDVRKSKGQENPGIATSMNSVSPEGTRKHMLSFGGVEESSRHEVIIDSFGNQKIVKEPMVFPTIIDPFSKNSDSVLASESLTELKGSRVRIGGKSRAFDEEIAQGASLDSDASKRAQSMLKFNRSDDEAERLEKNTLGGDQKALRVNDKKLVYGNVQIELLENGGIKALGSAIDQVKAAHYLAKNYSRLHMQRSFHPSVSSLGANFEPDWVKDSGFTTSEQALKQDMKTVSEALLYNQITGLHTKKDFLARRAIRKEAQKEAQALSGLETLGEAAVAAKDVPYLARSKPS